MIKTIKIVILVNTIFADKRCLRCSRVSSRIVKNPSMTVFAAFKKVKGRRLMIQRNSIVIKPMSAGKTPGDRSSWPEFSIKEKTSLVIRKTTIKTLTDFQSQPVERSTIKKIKRVRYTSASEIR